MHNFQCIIQRLELGPNLSRGLVLLAEFPNVVQTLGWIVRKRRDGRRWVIFRDPRRAPDHVPNGVGRALTEDLSDLHQDAAMEILSFVLPVVVLQVRHKCSSAPNSAIHTWCKLRSIIIISESAEILTLDL